MLRKDYIQRQFEEFGKVLALILGFKRDKDWERFEKEIANASKKYIPYELQHIENMSPAEFQKEILDQNDLLPDQQKILATLLFEKMNYYLEINDTKMYEALKAKTLSIYLKLRDNFTQNEFDLEVHYRIELLKNK